MSERKALDSVKSSLNNIKLVKTHKRTKTKAINQTAAYHKNARELGKWVKGSSNLNSRYTKNRVQVPLKRTKAQLEKDETPMILVEKRYSRKKKSKPSLERGSAKVKKHRTTNNSVNRTPAKERKQGPYSKRYQQKLQSRSRHRWTRNNTETEAFSSSVYLPTDTSSHYDLSSARETPTQSQEAELPPNRTSS